MMTMGTNATKENKNNQNQILELIQFEFAKPADQQIIKEIGSVLCKLGIKAGLRGYRYLKVAIKMSIDNPECLDAITKIIYPEVAKICKSTSSRVERSIRSAIGSIKDENQFRMEIFPDEYCPKYTNKEFIAGVAEYILMQQI